MLGLHTSQSALATPLLDSKPGLHTSHSSFGVSSPSESSKPGLHVSQSSPCAPATQPLQLAT